MPEPTAHETPWGDYVRPLCVNGKSRCGAVMRDGVAVPSGYIFGSWAQCIHGWSGRLAELEVEREHLLGLIAEHSSWLNDLAEQEPVNAAGRCLNSTEET